MLDAANTSHFTIRTGNGEPVDSKEAVFPIFRLDDAGRLHVLATGFFISEHGLFVSAKHVFTDVVDRSDTVADGLALLQFGKGDKFYPRPVQAFVVHEHADVGVGVCWPMKHKVTGQPLRNKVLTLCRTAPRVGARVWTYAYPGTSVIDGDPQHVSIDPRFYVGAVTRHFATGRDRVLLPYPCYETSIVLHGGSSGGPVFGHNGIVVGVNSTGGQGELLDTSFVSRITDILPLAIRNAQVLSEPEPRSVTIAELASLGHVLFREA